MIGPLSLKDQLERWVEAGILESSTANKISEFESSRESFSIGSWIVGLGVFAIGIGVIALVASNWEGISAPTKLGVDLFILVALAWGIHRFYFRSTRSWVSELLIGLMFFFVLASMALVGQIYQIDVELYRSLLTWVGTCTPLLLLARSHYLALLWSAAWVATFAASVPSVADWLDNATALENPLILVYLFVAPLVFRAFGVWSWFRKGFETHALALRQTSTLATILGAFVCSFPWYVDSSDFSSNDYVVGIGITGGIVLLIALLRKTLWPEHNPALRWIHLGFWGVGWLSLSLALIPLRGNDSEALAALFQFLVLALLIGWSLQKTWHTAFRVFVALAYLRILIAYFEIFGTLLDTGIALIGGGILVLGLAALWHNWIRRWSQKSP